jgi:muramidase (phage lysozyme)
MADNNDERLKDFPLLNDERVFNEDERRMMLNRIKKGDYEAASNVYNKKSGKIVTDFGAAAAPYVIGGAATKVGVAAVEVAAARTGTMALGETALGETIAGAIKTGGSVLKKGAETAKTAKTAIGETITGAIETGGSLIKKGTEAATPIIKQGYSKLQNVFKKAPEKEIKSAADKVGKAAKNTLKKGKDKGSSISKEMGKLQRIKKGAGALAEGYVLKEVIDEIGDFFSGNGDTNNGDGDGGDDLNMTLNDSGNRSIIPYAQGNMVNSSALFPETPSMEGQFIGRDSSTTGIGSSNKSDFILQQILDQLKEIKSINFSMLSTLNKLVSLQSNFNGMIQIMLAQQKNTERTDVPITQNSFQSNVSQRIRGSNQGLAQKITQGLTGLAAIAGSAILSAFGSEDAEASTSTASPISLDNINKKLPEESFGSGQGETYSPSIIDKTLANLLERVSIGEGTAGEKGYSTTLGFGKYDPAWAKGKTLEDMSLSEVYKLQSDMLKNPNNKLNSSAVGKYQIVRTTLFGKNGSAENPEKGSIAEILKLQPGDKFSKEVQDQIGVSLLKRRGLDKYKSGEISENRLLTNLSQEWASIANPQTGKALQHTGTTLEQISKAVRATKENVENSSNILTKENAEKLNLSPTKENAELLKSNLNDLAKQNIDTLISNPFDYVEKLNLSPTKENAEKLKTLSTAERIPTDTSMTAKLTPQTQILQNSNEIATASNNKEMNNVLQVALSSANKPQQVISPQYPRMDTPTKSVQTNIPDPRNITNGPLIDVLRSLFV